MNPPKPHRRYSWVQVDVPDPLRSELIAFNQALPLEAVVGDGIELDPHVTVRYGFDFNTPEEIAGLLQIYELGLLRLRVGAMSVFPATKSRRSEVLKLSIESHALRDVHNILGKFPNKHSFNFNPHITLAFLRVGQGRRFSGRKDFDGRSFVVEDLTFHSKDRKVYRIPL